MTNQNGAADHLVGQITPGGWEVLEKIKPKPNSTGGNFSTCYKVIKKGEIAFLKALNFSKVFNSLPPGTDLTEFLKFSTSSFIFERDVLKRCQDKRMSKVTSLLDGGQLHLDGLPFPEVPYLIFDLADSTIREKLEENIDTSFKLKSLHNICVGLNQLHNAKIAHQDLKPSNVLIYQNNTSKVADLGRSICHDIDGPHKDFIIPGDPEYAPPELHYNYYHPELLIRIYCTDLYLLGSLIVFYFTGFSMNAFFKDHLHPKFNVHNWKGSYPALLPYLESAFLDILSTIKDQIKPDELSNELIQIIKELCTPNIDKRGMPSLSNNISNRYSVYKYIVRLDVLYRKSYFNLFKS